MKPRTLTMFIVIAAATSLLLISLNSCTNPTLPIITSTVVITLRDGNNSQKDTITVVHHGDLTISSTRYPDYLIDQDENTFAKNVSRFSVLSSSRSEAGGKIISTTKR